MVRAKGDHAAQWAAEQTKEEQEKAINIARKMPGGNASRGVFAKSLGGEKSTESWKARTMAGFLFTNELKTCNNVTGDDTLGKLDPNRIEAIIDTQEENNRKDKKTQAETCIILASSPDSDRETVQREGPIASLSSMKMSTRQSSLVTSAVTDGVASTSAVAATSAVIAAVAATSAVIAAVAATSAVIAEVAATSAVITAVAATSAVIAEVAATHIEFNVRYSSKYSMYSSTLPPFLKNRPRSLVEHILSRYEDERLYIKPKSRVNKGGGSRGAGHGDAGGGDATPYPPSGAPVAAARTCRLSVAA
ncbi:Hypp6842 [Branchiostoma lanceolatum]|uniref:Hypp6842 protein n=1 Tax=Branchiostoma lanceolatum TaxID=7740 RepID=A0A8J9YVP9_BRALA|nr:Hypp6842 [Branchiostoma lanceolatum]